MEILFVKYSDLTRSSKYKIKTEIFKESGKKGRKLVSKTALNEESKQHIINIYQNAQKLKQSGFKLELVNSWLENNKVYFDYVEGKTLDNVLIDIYFSKGIDAFLEKLKEIKEIVDDNWNIEIANLDMILDNMIQKEDGSITVIDYEWIYEGEIEKEFIFYRLLEIFYNKYIPYFFRKLSFEKLTKYFFDEKILTKIEKKNEEFYTERTSSGIKIETKDLIGINELPHLQIFYNYGEGFFEEDSVKYYFDYTKEIDLKIPIKKGITSLRIDPKNFPLKLEVGKRIFKDLDGGEVKAHIISNAECNEGEIYNFSTEDPQMYFNNLPEGVLNFSFVEI